MIQLLKASSIKETPLWQYNIIAKACELTTISQKTKLLSIIFKWTKQSQHCPDTVTHCNTWKLISSPATQKLNLKIKITCAKTITNDSSPREKILHDTTKMLKARIIDGSIRIISVYTHLGYYLIAVTGGSNTNKWPLQFGR